MGLNELQQIANYFAEAKLHDMEQTVLNNIKRLENLERALEIYERERDRFKHNKPELTGEYFLAGGYGEKDTNMLPEFVRICPAYGCAWEQIYVKTDRTVSYEGS